MKQIWKPVTGYKGLYEVSNFGNVRTLRDSIRLNKYDLMKKCKHSAGYLRVNLVKDGKAKMKYIHVIELRAFKGKKPKGYDSNHKDLDKTNNYLWNLEYLTHKENIRHARKNKKDWKKVYKNSISGLNEYQNKFIYYIYNYFKNNNGISPTFREIGLHFGISKQGAYDRYKYILEKIERYNIDLKKSA